MIVIDRAITLSQPWASLMAIGAKKNETRGRRTSYRGWLAIHAASKYAHQPHGYIDATLRAVGLDPLALPTGKILAVVEVFECVCTNSLLVGSPEALFGNYSRDRWAYLTRGLRLLREPIAARGFQAIPWRLKVPILESDLLP